MFHLPIYLAINTCSETEWSRFIAHTNQKHTLLDEFFYNMKYAIYIFYSFDNKKSAKLQKFKNKYTLCNIAILYADMKCTAAFM